MSFGFMIRSTGSKMLVADINPPEIIGGPGPSLTVVDDKLYFVPFDAQDNDGNPGIWVYDPTNGNPTPVSLNAGAELYQPEELTTLDGKLYFTAENASQRNIWVYDRVTGYTTLASESHGPNKADQLTVLGDKIYFSDSDGISGYELWVYDPATGNSMVVDDIYGGTDSSLPKSLTAIDGNLYFTADDGFGIKIWVHDPIAGTTEPVSDFQVSADVEFVSLGGKLYFSGIDGNYGSELWVSDPTNGQTTLVADLNPGGTATTPYSSFPRELTVVDDKLYFSADDGISGRELWVYDPETGAPPERVYDIATGPD